MNNAELFQLFLNIQRESENLFDVAVQLKRMSKQYKRSELYRETHMSIDEAYKLFCMNGLSELIKFLNKDVIANTLKGDFALLREEIMYFFDTFDYSVLDGLWEKLEQKIKEIDFTDIQESLDEILEGFKVR